MKLVPNRPPGPNARKAREYEEDILQLRALGYTFEAIREALAAAGTRVSNSTVQREVARASKYQPPARTSTPASTQTSLTEVARGSSKTSAPPPATTLANFVGVPINASLPEDWGDGKDVAKAYTSTLSINPIARGKEKR